MNLYKQDPSISYSLFLYAQEINLFETDTTLHLKLILTINFKILLQFISHYKETYFALKRYIPTEVIFFFKQFYESFKMI